MSAVSIRSVTPLTAPTPSVAPPTGRGLPTPIILATTRPHGDRLRYLAGCRCDACRKANTTYERQRQAARKNGDWNGIVPAAAARDHLFELSAAGVGRRAVAAATDIAETVLSEIRSGQKARIRARTERLILAVTPAMASDGALIAAGPTWVLIDELTAAGFTKGRIAEELGCESLALQIGTERVTVRNAHRVARVHEELMASDEVLVPARPTKKRITALRAEQFTEKQLARWLGLVGESVRISTERVTRGFEKRVLDLFERLMN